MSEVTQDMILDYLIKKGGTVKNVDLVRHFRKFLQNESTSEKGKGVRTIRYPRSPLSLLCVCAGDTTTLSGSS